MLKYYNQIVDDPLMLINEILREAPLADFDMIGDPDTEGSFRPDDLKKFRNPVWRDKIVNAFKNTPYKFNIYMLNGEGGRVSIGGRDLEVRDLGNLEKYVGINPMSVVARLIGKEPPDTKDSITVLMVENEGTNRVGLTPWMLAHRTAHALLYAGQQADRSTSAGYWQANTIRAFYGTMDSLINESVRYLEHSQNFSHMNWNSPGRSVAQVIGKMRSAKTGNLASVAEFYVEVIAQYLVTGAVSFNRPDLDDKGRTAIDPAEGIIPADMRSLARVVDSAEEFVNRLKDYQEPRKPTSSYNGYDDTGKLVATSSRPDRLAALGYTVKEKKPTRYQIGKYNKQVKSRQKMIDEWNDWKSLGLLDWLQQPNTQTSQFDRHLDQYEPSLAKKIEAILQMCVGKALIL